MVSPNVLLLRMCSSMRSTCSEKRKRKVGVWPTAWFQGAAKDVHNMPSPASQAAGCAAVQHSTAQQPLASAGSSSFSRMWPCIQ